MHLEGVPQPKDRPIKLSAYHWKKRRRELFDRASGRCERCRVVFYTLSDLHAHHMVKRSKHRDDSLANLLALCFKCHGMEHNQKW